MNPTEQLLKILPPNYTADLNNIRCLRVIDAIELPGKSRTIMEYRWLLRGVVSRAFFISVDEQAYDPNHDTIIVDIKMYRLGSYIHRCGFWRGSLCNYEFLVSEYPLMSTSDGAIYDTLDKSKDWIHLVMGQTKR